MTRALALALALLSMGGCYASAPPEPCASAWDGYDSRRTAILERLNEVQARHHCATCVDLPSPSPRACSAGADRTEDIYDAIAAAEASQDPCMALFDLGPNAWEVCP